MKPLRILLVVGSLPPMKCGVGDYTAELTRALAKQADSVSAVGALADVHAQLTATSIGVEVLPLAKGWRLSDAGPILAGVRQFAPDIVHFQFPSQGYGRRWLPWLLPSAVHVLGYPQVQTWHEYFEDWRNRGMWKNLPNALLPGGLVAVRPEYLTRMPRLLRWLCRRKVFRFLPNASVIPAATLSDSQRRDIREKYGGTSRRLVMFFGFAYPSKGVEMLFSIADPSKDQLVLASDLDPKDTYHAHLIRHIESGEWKGRARATGYLPSDELARLLAVADAVVFPFRDGGGPWNSSLHAARAQGTFVLMSASEEEGYDPALNVCYVRPGDTRAMRAALDAYAGRRSQPDQQAAMRAWDDIAKQHLRLYAEVLRS